MEFILKNCNNIDEAIISITPNKLNIKFGINGTGKSTVTKAIELGIKNPENLNLLTPFKLKNVETDLKPEVVLPDNIKSVLIFNEEYLNQFLFKEDELIANSYEIFIKTPEFENSTLQIEQLLIQIKNVFTDNESLTGIISDFENLSKSFSTTQTGLSKSSPLYKGLKDGNKLEHVPENLKGYSKLIKDKNCVSWLDWQIKGEQYMEISEDCPYCTSPTEDKKEIIQNVSKVYDKNVVKNFNIILEALKSLGDYFSESASHTLKLLTEKQTGLEKAEEDYVVEVKSQIDNLLGKLRSLKNISSTSFGENDKVNEILEGLKINIELFDRFKSEKTTEIIETLNSSLDTVLERVGVLQGELNKQRKIVKILIERHKKSINSFLLNAGYKYIVELGSEGNDYKLLLQHIDSNSPLNGGKQHLSFGEKNAFALVLFMYEVLFRKPDLIILDDPISSFDKNKKYAIMHMLFRNESSACLKSKNVMMLTHDLDPVIDTVKVLKEFSGISESKFIYIKSGMLKEKDIKKENLLTFAQICKKAILSNIDDIIKLIYLRRHHEIIDDLGNEYQVLSNLLHKRNKYELKDTRKEIGDDLMDTVDFDDGCTRIMNDLVNFNYENMLQNICDDIYLNNIFENAVNNYIKLNIFRLLYDDQLQELSSVLRKFINESYHIENELICQLDPNEYELIPDFIVDECKKYILEKMN
jgi:energy-coupling factor transporter ATP-binding protein EcfA2